MNDTIYNYEEMLRKCLLALNQIPDQPLYGISGAESTMN